MQTYENNQWVRKLILVDFDTYEKLDESLINNGQTFSGLMRVLIHNYLKQMEAVAN